MAQRNAQQEGEPVAQRPSPRHVVVMGVSGSGKTTVAELLSDQLGWRMAEGDDFHPEANVAKMAAGTPLTDDDRWPWLRTIRDWISEQHEAGRSSVTSCSALRRAYRDVLRGAAGPVAFVLLDGDAATLEERMGTRQGHFMPAKLLRSQLATLEPLEADEHGAVLDLSHTPQHLVAEAVAALDLG